MQPAAELGSQQGQSLRQQCLRELARRGPGEGEAPGTVHVMIDGEVSEARTAPGPWNPQSLVLSIVTYPCMLPPPQVQFWSQASFGTTSLSTFLNRSVQGPEPQKYGA